MICVVRKKEQEESCKNAGATHIFNSNDTNFDTDLKKACLEEDCTLAFDAVSKLRKFTYYVCVLIIASPFALFRSAGP